MGCTGGVVLSGESLWHGMQGRKERERETLKIALEFAEGRGVRALGDALGWCL